MQSNLYCCGKVAHFKASCPKLKEQLKKIIRRAGSPRAKKKVGTFEEEEDSVACRFV